MFPVPGIWCVYFLRLRDGTLYCGMTNDLAKRLKTHEKGKGSRLVWAKRPFEIVWFEQVTEGKGAALKREYALKKLRKSEKEDLIARSQESQAQLKEQC